MSIVRSSLPFGVLFVFGAVAAASVACSTEIVTAPLDPVPTGSTSSSSSATPSPSASETAAPTASATETADAAPPPAAAPKLEISAAYAVFQPRQYSFAIQVKNLGAGASDGFSKLTFDFGGKKLDTQAPCDGFPQPANTSQTIQFSITQSSSATGVATYSVSCPSGRQSIGNFVQSAPLTYEGSVTVGIEGKTKSGVPFSATTVADKQQ
jgi:hypothetical protein